MTAAAAVSTSWIPTRKWISALVAGLFTVVGQAVATNGWDATEWGALLTLAASLATAYGISNS